MPKITFEKEVTEDQYDLLQVALKLGKISQDDFIWAATQGSILAELESADTSKLAEATRIVDYQEQFKDVEASEHGVE
ncbi:hypothetical protein [Candidatus Nitrososphaera sp. FF02]|uniref:hypothetical protein n=1 Tax=Candidatus Nitrososphaera sp. FF02 TaxID=3398226 RepID=UPI0039E90F8B